MSRSSSQSVVVVVLALLAAAPALAQNNPPVVSNVTAAQRGDASRLVDIHYTLADADGDACTVWVSVSDDSGASWRVCARTFTGDIGNGVTPGTNKSVVWDAGADMAGRVGSNFKVRVFADDGNGPAPMVLVPSGWFPYQNTTNPASWVFVDTFLIDKYETTNALYCQFLNNSDPNAVHWDANQEIDRWGSSGSYTYSVKTGKDNYPIRYVSYNDAVAFATWRSAQTGQTYRLPDTYEWEKAAAWDPVGNHYYRYGFHRDTIDCNWCVYNNCYGASNPMRVGYLDGTGGHNNAKNYYGAYDMSGNVFEWTSELSGSYRVCRGGSWNGSATSCLCTYSGHNTPTSRYDYVGFRLVLDPD